MSTHKLLGEFEQLVLLALAHLGDSAYGLTIRQEIAERSGRTVSIAAIYAVLGRLERARYVASWLSKPTAVRGGRAKKHFRMTPAGVAALSRCREALMRMWEGVDLLPDASAHD